MRKSSLPLAQCAVKFIGSLSSDKKKARRGAWPWNTHSQRKKSLRSPFDWEFDDSLRIGRFFFCLDGERSNILPFGSSRAVEIFVNGEECVGLQLAEGATEFLLYTVNLMEKRSAIHAQLHAAEFPICAE
jgi:hypothetical protein